MKQNKDNTSRAGKPAEENGKGIFCFSLLTLSLFLLLAWLWASWWMGDIFRIAYEYSFFAPDATLMHWLWQKSFGWLWIIGRALLTLYHQPLLGGLFVAILLTAGSWLLGYCLRLSQRWRWVQYLPAAAWMIWTAHVGLNLYYMREPGRILAIPFLFVVVCGILAAVAFGFRSHESQKSDMTYKSSIFQVLFLLVLFALPMIHLHQRHPYMRALTHMQVQLLHNDFEGMSRTAHEHADMCNRQMAGYYVIALARTGHLADQLFDIKLEFDTVKAYGYGGRPNACMKYHVIDCNYYAGLYRVSRHNAMESMTLDGPSLFTLKMLAKIALLDGDSILARKYLHIIRKAPFEGDFFNKYAPMAEHPELVKADPEFAAILNVVPPYHSFENLFLQPAFIGFYANLRTFRNPETLTWSLMANLYSKRMPDFLMRCQKLTGTTTSRSIAEGLVLQSQKFPAVVEAFPQLKMDLQRLEYFIQDATPYMNDRDLGNQVLFEKYKGYYPYYYFFCNLHGARADGNEDDHPKSGVN